MKEIWKNIPGYEGLYQISSKKRIKNIKTGKCKTSNISKVSLSKNGKSKSTTIKYLYKISFRTFNNKNVYIRPFNLNNEEWKDIEGYDGLYQISNYGRVKSLHYSKEKILKQTLTKTNYYQIRLSKNGITKQHYVHRLVAKMFVYNNDIDNKTIINHKDENPMNNHYTNLEWCTQEYNINYGTRTKRQVETMKNKEINHLCKKVYCLELDRVFPSIQSIADEFGYCRENITCCLRNKDNQQTAYKMHWYYVND